MSDEERYREALEKVAHAGEFQPVAPLARLARAALHPAESFYACPTCGENVTRYGQRCPTCERAIEHDRLERESGR